ncbi:MAG: UvrD-helicase domain-containing protein [Ghiorsea sp.]
MSTVIDAKERKLAIDPSTSYLVQAPAGSGKTELLIQRILALLAHVDQPEEILALTFTRKAAAEMRERVLHALQKAEEPEPQEKHALTTWNLAKTALAQSELKGWRLTSHPAQLRIMTIDAFASGLARQLPILSGFGQTPTTADFTEPLYQSAVKDLIEYAMQRNALAPLKEAVNTLILHLDCNIGKVSNLLCVMLGRREQWLPAVLEQTPDMLVFKQHLEESLETVIEHTLHEAFESLPIGIRGTLPALASFAEEQMTAIHGSDHVFSPFANLSSCPEPDINHMAQWKALAHLLLVKDKPQARKSPTVREGFPAGATFKPQKDAMKEILSFIQTDENLLNQIHQIRLLPDNAHFQDSDWLVLEALFTTLKMLAGQLWQTFAQHKKVDFVEVMLRAKQALGQTDALGHIIPSEALLRLDYKIKHILVDEFQDTATLQIDLLARLTAGWENDGRTLFMVGDPMQSIYRFRKAEVSLFLRAAQNDLPLPHVTSLTLSQNFRSSPDIVGWVNQAFSNVLPQNDDILAGAISYSPSQAFKSESGDVSLHVFKQRSESQEAEEMIKIIQHAKAEQKKVGVLARNRRHLHKLMLSLQEAGIPFRAMDMLPLNKQSEIIDLRTLTCALLHPCDFIAWAGLLRSPAIGLRLASLHAIFNTKPSSPWLAVQAYAETSNDADEKKRLSMFIQAMKPAMQQCGRVALRKLIESTWLHLSVARTLNPTQLANTDLFFELLEHIEDETEFDISLLDKRLEKLFAKPESLPQADQVELLTMHGAKGLQWDTVILPGLGKTPRPKDKDVLAQTETNTHDGQKLLISPIPHSADKNKKGGTTYQLIHAFEKQRDKLEIARLLYVACTRAESSLHLLGHVSEATEEPASSSLLALLWQDIEHCYGASISVHEAASEAESFTALSAPVYQHIVDIETIVEPQPSIHVHQLKNTTLINHKPEFSWAGASAKAVGIAVHAALQHVAEIGFELWTETHTKQASNMMKSVLLHEGISLAHLDKALRRCIYGLNQCLNQSTKAKWLLSNQHQACHNEWPLTYVDEGICKHIVLDRSFIDEDGVRWVIDYKTGGHAGEGLDDFLDQELLRYTKETPQLPSYVKALKALEPEREIKAALYFPMVDGWRVWL